MSYNIQQLEKEIQVKKNILKVMKIEEKQKNKKLFIESYIGQKYLKTIEFCTRPFKNMNQKAFNMLECPSKHKRDNIEKQARKLLQKAKKINGIDCKTANKLVKNLMDLQECCDKYGHNENSVIVIDLLEKEITRIRPPKEQSKLNKLETMLNGIKIQ